MKKQTSNTELQAAKKQDEAALAAIIARHMAVIRYFAYRAVSPGLDFDDALQEGLIGLFRAIEQYDKNQNASFSTYANVCIRNAIFAAQKAATRKKHAPLNQSVPIPAEQSTPGPEEEAIQNEQLSLVIEKVQTRLSPLEKQVLRCYLNGLSYQEIGLKLGKSPKAIDNALSRLRRKLK